MRYLIKVEYDGSQFYGFQRQSSKKTVQGELEHALSIIAKKDVIVKGAGRTDVGVHALGQCAHFDLDICIPEDRLKTAINSIVHPYIHVVSCRGVSLDFHARFSVCKKRYVYKIWCGEFSPLNENYYLQYRDELDVDKLRECASLFIGSYNFHNFVSGKRNNYNGTIYNISIEEKGNEVWISFLGKSFYRYMVRNLVGAMLDYSIGKCDLLLIERMLKEDNFDYQLSCAPAKGLYLEGVYYE